MHVLMTLAAQHTCALCTNQKDSCHEQTVRSDEYALVSANAPLCAGVSNCLLDTVLKCTDAVTPLLFTNKHMRTNISVDKACVQEDLT